MNIGIRFHDLAPGTIAQRAAVAHAQGFTCAHLALYKALENTPPISGFSEAFTQSLKQEIQPLSIAILGCHLNLAHPDEAVYQDTLARYFAHLQLASQIGNCIVGTETGSPNLECRYDPLRTHSEEALQLLISRLRPVVQEAERLQTTIAIEPVYTNIVSTPQRARIVLDAIASPCLKIILDPVNLLHPDCIHQREEIISSALELLGPDIAAVHLKDYRCLHGKMITLASGLGDMDDHQVLSYIVDNMPNVPVTLENTRPDNAHAAREHIAALYGEFWL